MTPTTFSTEIKKERKNTALIFLMPIDASKPKPLVSYALDYTAVLRGKKKYHRRKVFEQEDSVG